MIISKAAMPLENLPQLKCRGEVIEYVSEFKYLGILFDPTLTFNRHFDYVCRKVSSAVGCLMLLKRFINLRVFKCLVNSFIISHIDYGLTVWGSVSASHVKILQSKINNILGAFFYPQLINKYQRLSKIAHKCENEYYRSFHINYLELHETCNLLTVQERIQYFYLILAFKSTQTNSIPEVKEHFKFGQSSRNRILILPSHKTKFYEKSPIYMSMTTWNTLCSEAKEAGLSLSKFTRIINQWLISNRLEEFVST